MLMATLESTGLSEFWGSAQVEGLQSALKSLAQAANWPAADPGPIDGVVGVKTLTAVNAVINNVQEIPSTVRTALTVVLALAMTDAESRAKAFELVATYASELTTAITVAIARYSGANPPSNTGTGQIKIGTVKHMFATKGVQVTRGPSSGGSFWTPPPGTPWYKQGRVYAIGGGIAALGVGAFFLFRR